MGNQLSVCTHMFSLHEYAMQNPQAVGQALGQALVESNNQGGTAAQSAAVALASVRMPLRLCLHVYGYQRSILKMSCPVAWCCFYLSSHEYDDIYGHVGIQCHSVLMLTLAWVEMPYSSAQGHGISTQASIHNGIEWHCINLGDPPTGNQPFEGGIPNNTTFLSIAFPCCRP
jgi:hypothetical protein